jgi:hypothetical protein
LKINSLLENILDYFRRMAADPVSRNLIDWRRVVVDIGPRRESSPLWRRRDYAELCGSIAGSTVSVSLFPGAIRLVLSHPTLLDPFVVSLIFRDGFPTTVLPERLYLMPSKQGVGTATRIFATQARAAKRLRFREVVVLALMNDEDSKNIRHNGAYTIARLGFDCPLTREHLAKLPSEFAKCRLLSELLATDNGRKAWKEHAVPIRAAFDLALGSAHQQTLKKYLKLKQIRLP